ncbi:MAG: hypothetical protein HYY31_02975 [Chloroflexi bacterium]|nr:hypothetical protein [Chloroflexota bacterium]
MLDPDTKRGRIGREYAEDLFLFSASYLCIALRRMLEFLTRLVVTTTPDWTTDIAQPTLKDLEACEKRLAERAKELR